MRSKSVKSKRKLDEDNNKIINNNNNTNDKNIVNTNKISSREKRIEMSYMIGSNKNVVTYINKNSEKRNNTKLENESSEISFNINDKITCNVTYINFTNYIIKDEDFTKDKDISNIKRLFNHNFEKFYKTIELDNGIKIVKEKNLIYLTYDDISNISNISFSDKEEISKDKTN